MRWYDKETGKQTRNQRDTREVSGTVNVGGFTRHMRMPARAYIRSTIQSRTSEYVHAMSSAILAAWKSEKS